MPTTALQYYEQVHGTNTEWLSKDAIVTLMTQFADKRFFEFQKAKQDFQAERWTNELNARRGKQYKPPSNEKPI